MGCNKSTYAGIYSFQLGKTSGSHIGIFLHLDKEYYNAEKPELGQGYSLEVDLGSMDKEVVTDNLETSLEEDVANDLDLKDFVVNGYYTIGEKQKEGGKKLNLNVTSVGRDNDDDGKKEEAAFPSELMDKFLYATISSESVEINIPVSLEDLAFQLYWYGYDINILDFSFDILPDDQHHEIGTHPTKDDVENINKTYKDSHLISYRDFYNLKMGLNKK